MYLCYPLLCDILDFVTGAFISFIFYKVIFELVLILYDSPDRVSEARQHMFNNEFDAAPVNILKMEPLELLDYVNTLEHEQMASLIFYLVKLIKRLS